MFSFHQLQLCDIKLYFDSYVIVIKELLLTIELQSVAYSPIIAPILTRYVQSSIVFIQQSQ